jgi:diguanylate cyclase (GGDEF)-like protein/PAS domain S-box-containing protein
MRTTIDPGTLLKHIYDSATDFAIFTTGLNGEVSSWNAGAERILGFSQEEIVGNDLSRIFTSEDIAAGEIQREMATAASTGRASDYRWHMRKDGRRFWADGVMTPIRDDGREIIGFLKILQDITERKTAQDEINRLATVDPLTGLANRAAFDKRTHEMIALCARGGQSLQLFMIDLDRFKEVNDTLGHQAGDELLRQVAHRLKEASRESDFVGRLGGDEFGFLQFGPAHLASGGVFASKIVERLARPFDIGDSTVQISASVGIASCPVDCANPEGLLKKADLALYKAKSAGRNCFHHFTEELDDIARKRSTDSEELRKVVAERRFWLEYQPIIDCSTGKATAMEALIRFPGPILSGYTVDYAIDLAREIGIISDIGGWVFAEACMQLMRWKSTGLSELRICINTCATELLDAGYLASIQSAMEQSGASAQDIEIELTERDAIDLMSVGSSVLGFLATAGFRLSLDDFGTGYSSLSYLRSLPVATLKLDKSFLCGVPAERDANAVAKAVITLANDLSLQVIAEGVEDRSQARFLQEMDCSAVQGFLFSKAMPSIPATEWLLANCVTANRPSVFLPH